jgi:hypothetical protein
MRRLGPVAAAASLAVLMLVAGCTAPGTPTGNSPTTTAPTTAPPTTATSPIPNPCEIASNCPVGIDPLEPICPTAGCTVSLVRSCYACKQVLLDWWTQVVNTSPDQKTALETGQASFDDGAKVAKVTVNMKNATAAQQSKLQLVIAAQGKVLRTITMTIVKA